MSNIKKGSGKYRTILHKQSTPKELHSPTNWRSKLNDTTITSKHIKQFRKNLQSRYISSEIACKITRLKLGKTLFGNQLPHIGSDETTFCKTCIRETQTETVEDLAHGSCNLYVPPHTNNYRCNNTTFLPRKCTHSHTKGHNTFLYQQSAQILRG